MRLFIRSLTFVGAEYLEISQLKAFIGMSVAARADGAKLAGVVDNGKPGEVRV